MIKEVFDTTHTFTARDNLEGQLGRLTQSGVSTPKEIMKLKSKVASIKIDVASLK